jgi:hypothetical protein
MALCASGVKGEFSQSQHIVVHILFTICSIDIREIARVIFSIGSAIAVEMIPTVPTSASKRF